MPTDCIPREPEIQVVLYTMKFATVSCKVVRAQLSTADLGLSFHPSAPARTSKLGAAIITSDRGKVICSGTDYCTSCHIHRPVKIFPKPQAGSGGA